MKTTLLGMALLLATTAICRAQERTAQSPLTPQEREQWRKTLASYDYLAIAQAYAEFMIEHGRDVYGKEHTPLFVTGMDRHTGQKISPPFAHVKRKPFMPGWERDRELRESDRNYGHADPLDQAVLLQLLHRLTALTGDNRYAAEADKTAAWWMANTQTAIGLYPWGTHTLWDVDQEKGGIHPYTGSMFEFNHVWPYWHLNPDALQVYARALWDHYIYDKHSGEFNRHADCLRHAPGRGMEFPWPGSAMIATWAEAYLANPDQEYVRAIRTVLKRWESLRDGNGHLAPCSNYQEWAWYVAGGGSAVPASRLDDWADRLEAKEPELAAEMRDYGRKCDAAFLKLADDLLDVKRVGIVGSYVRQTGDYNPDRLDIIGGPWQDRKDYAAAALALHGRMKRSDSEAHRERYRQAVLDTAEIYMSVNPEVQWAVWGTNMAHAIRLLVAAHELTGNTAYLHRADQFGHLAVDLLVDDSSPLPKITSHDDFYEIERVDGETSDAWMLAILELRERLATIDQAQRQTTRIATTGGVWDCTKLTRPAASVSLSYGEDGQRTLFLSRREKSLTPVSGLPIDGLELIASDHVNSIPTLEQVKSFNGAYRRKFSGKYREPSTATYGGFKDVLDRADLTLVHHGKEAAEVTVAVTYHDSWDDRETKVHAHTLAPGASVTVNCAAPAKRFIRRIDLDSTVAGAVKLERFTFAMAPRSKLNPLTGDAAALDLPFRDAEPRLVNEGLVVHLNAERLSHLMDGSPVDTWPNSADPRLAATAEGGRRPIFIREGGRAAVRFDGVSSYFSIPDHDALDMKAWTLIVYARANGGPGVIASKTDERTMMANYRLQVDSSQSISSMVRGPSAAHNVNRQAKADVLERFALMAARFDPKAKGKEQITIQIDGYPAVYSYEDARGDVTAITHDRPLEIGRQPGREPRYFQGDMTDILLYNRALTDDELNKAARWLSESKTVQPSAKSDSVQDVRHDSAADESHQSATAPAAIAWIEQIQRKKPRTTPAGTRIGQDDHRADEAKRPDPTNPKREALLFLIAGQSNAGGVAAFSPETNTKAGLATRHPTIPGSTAKEVGIPTDVEAYPRSYIWADGFERLTPGKNLKGGYHDPWRHGIELPMAMLLEKQYPQADKYFVKHGPGGHNLHTQWKAGSGPDYKAFISQFRGAMAELDKRHEKVHVIGLYWDQGESDQPKAGEYGDNLRALFAALRKDTGLPDLPIFVRKHLFQHDQPEFAPIIKAQVAVSEVDSHTHLLDIDLGSNEKNIKAWAWTDNNGHLSSRAYLELAERIARAMALPRPAPRR